MSWRKADTRAMADAATGGDLAIDCDYAIVGAGAAGLVLAERLSADPTLRVVVIEAGARRRSPLLAVPAGETLLLGNPAYDWRFVTEPDPTLGGRRLSIPRGRLVGGSAALNGMIFVRGQPDDYDAWARAGCSGWSWAEVLPHFRAIETWQDGAGIAGTRGTDGPIRVARPGEREPLASTFLAAAVQAGFPLAEDYNSGRLEGFAEAQCSLREGCRSSVLDTLLPRLGRRANVTLLADTRALKVLLAGQRCTGVEAARGGARILVRAARETVLCAGTLMSPHLLEHSGIGDPAALARAGLPCRHALLGVGAGLRDHVAARLRWRIAAPPGAAPTFNERTRGLALLREIARYAVSRRGVLASPIAVCVGFARSAPDEPVPDLQFHFAPASYPVSDRPTRRLDRLPGMTIGVYPLRPEAEGSVHAVSPDPLDPPEIRTAVLGPAEDRRRLLAGIRIARAIVAAPAFDGLRGEELVPGSDLASDEALVAHLRETADTSYHPIGTCRMGTGPDAVVDPRLRVVGLDGLRVADASILPTHVSGNTQAPTMMIADKAARLLLEEARGSRAPQAPARAPHRAEA